MPRLKAGVVTLFLATLSVPASLAAQSTYGAVPGSLNFVQGQVNIDGHLLDPKDTQANQPHQLRTGETLATANGSADILLAPGALLRLGQDSTVRMVDGDANRTEVLLEQGRANVSVNAVRHEHLLLIDMQHGQTQMLSRGLYTFNAATNTMRVFDGEAYAFPGSDTTADVKPVTVKESHAIVLGGDHAKPEKFDREMADDDLLPWIGPRETQAALADSTVPRGNDASYGDGGYGSLGNSGGYGEAAYYPGAYGFSGYGDSPYYGYGYPYGFGPYGFGGYPFFGVGFGYFGGGFYGGGYGHGGYPPIKGPGRFGGTAGRGFAGARSVGGGFHGGGFGAGGGGFHGGGFGAGGGGFHGGGGGHR